MNLYLVSQDINNDYDTYDSMIVAAESEAQARLLHPGDSSKYKIELNPWDEFTWVKECNIDILTVELIGQTTKPQGVILASFNAG